MNVDGTYAEFTVCNAILIRVRCGVRVRGSLGLGIRVGVLELSSVSRLLSVPIIGSHYLIEMRSKITQCQ